MNWHVQTRVTKRVVLVTGIKKPQNHLEKLNSDSNMTAGLEAKLRLAVGARVVLRRNTDTSAGLVNGAIGTVRAIAKCNYFE